MLRPRFDLSVFSTTDASRSCFLKKFFIDSLGVYHIPTSVHLPDPLSSSHPCHAPTPHIRKQFKVNNQADKKKSKTKNLQQKQNEIHNNRKLSLLLLLSCFSNTSSFMLVAMEASVCPIVHLLVPSVSLSLIWFEASGLWYPNQNSSEISCGCH